MKIAQVGWSPNHERLCIQPKIPIAMVTPPNKFDGLPQFAYVTSQL
jgi:hypothetical protein